MVTFKLRGRSPARRLAATTVLALVLPAVLLAAPAAATGATVYVTKPCYVNANPFMAAPITVIGTGWIPGDRISLGGGQFSGTATAGSDGTFVQTIAGMDIGKTGPADRRERLTASDEGNPVTGAPANGMSASTSFLIANLAFSISPSNTSLQKKVTFRFSGFRPGRHIYAHFVHRGQPVAREDLGRASGACGMQQIRAYQYPGEHPRYNDYTVQFDNVRTYDKRAKPQVRTKLTIYRY